MQRPRVLLADDHRIVTDALANYLKADFELVGRVEDGAKLLESARTTVTDVIVADISMPVMNGLEAMRKLRQTQPEVKVIFLTMHRDAALAGEALRAGAKGYILKHCAGEELVTAIHRVLDGKIFLSPLIEQEVLAGLASGSIDKPGDRLTPRQRDVLQLVVAGYSMKEIAAQLRLSPRTVETHKYEMMQTLGVQSTAELVNFALTNHYVG